MRIRAHMYLIKWYIERCMFCMGCSFCSGVASCASFALGSRMCHKRSRSTLRVELYFASVSYGFSSPFMTEVPHLQLPSECFFQACLSHLQWPSFGSSFARTLESASSRITIERGATTLRRQNWMRSAAIKIFPASRHVTTISGVNLLLHLLLLSFSSALPGGAQFIAVMKTNTFLM